MNARAWLGIGIVGILGAAAAAGLVYINRGGANQPLPAPADIPTEADATPSPRTKARVAKPTFVPDVPPNTAGGSASGVSNPTAANEPEPVAASLGELTGRYEDALDAQFDIDPTANGSDPEERDRSLRGQLLSVTGQVTGAAEAHLEFAKTAPRADAEVAHERAAELYDHLSTVIAGAPIPEGLPPAEVDIQRKVLRRLSESHARKASSIRATGGGGQ